MLAVETPDPDRLADATRLAQLLGPDVSPTELLGVVATHDTRDSPLTVETLVDGTESIDRSLATSIFEFLLSKGYASEENGSVAIHVDSPDCLQLLIATRTAHQVIEQSRADTEPIGVEFVCTLPENDPGFEHLDPVDFDMQQITTRLLTLCRNASEELVLTSPFLEIEGMEWLLPGLEGALERGVDLTLVSRELRSQQPNHAAVQELFNIAAGLPGQLEVYDYYEPDPDDQYPEYTLHSKLLIADRSAAYVGSANFTKYGFAENLEIGVVVEAPAVRALYSVVAHLIANSGVRVER